MHPAARAAAFASECAARQSSFERMHDLLFDLRDSLGVLPWRTFAERSMVRDLPEFDRCMRDSIPAGSVNSDLDAARRLGATGTPTLLIDGVRFIGSVREETLDSLIQRAIHSAAKRR